jgi:hypothetical protein
MSVDMLKAYSRTAYFVLGVQIESDRNLIT